MSIPLKMMMLCASPANKPVQAHGHSTWCTAQEPANEGQLRHSRVEELLRGATWRRSQGAPQLSQTPLSRSVPVAVTACRSEVSPLGRLARCTVALSASATAWEDVGHDILVSRPGAIRERARKSLDSGRKNHLRKLILIRFN